MLFMPQSAKLPYAINSNSLTVGLALIPFMLVILASVPAIMIMPFTPNGLVRAERYVTIAASCTVAILSASRSGGR
jgi:hypothetical protein